MRNLIADALSRVPKPFNVNAIAERYPTRHDECLSTVLVQELLRYKLQPPPPRPSGGLRGSWAGVGLGRPWAFGCDSEAGKVPGGHFRPLVKRGRRHAPHARIHDVMRADDARVPQHPDGSLR